MNLAMPHIPHPFPDSLPSTWSLNDRVNAELGKTLSVLKNKHQLDLVMGGEFEAILRHTSKEQQIAVAQEVRQKLPDIVIQDKDYWDLHYQDANEVRMVPCPLAEFPARRLKLIDTFRDAASHHGIDLRDITFFDMQLSISAWKQGRNIFEYQHADLRTDAKKSAAGLVDMMLDCGAFIYKPYHIMKEVQGQKNDHFHHLRHVTLGDNRNYLFRFDATKGRIEFRNEHEMLDEHTELMLLLLAKGIQYGLENKTKSLVQTWNSTNQHISAHDSIIELTPDPNLKKNYTETLACMNNLIRRSRSSSLLKHSFYDAELLDDLCSAKEEEFKSLITQFTRPTARIAQAVFGIKEAISTKRE